MESLNNIITNAALLTILIEVPIFYAFGYRRTKEILAFLVVNFISNTLLNDVLPSYTPDFVYWTKVCLGEILVLALEYALMLHIICNKKERLLCILFITNTVSIILGIILLYKF